VIVTTRVKTDRISRTARTAAIAPLLLLLAASGTAFAQQLEPRAYSPSPIGTNFFGVGYLFMHGGATLDPSVPIENVKAQINSVVPYYGRAFGLVGRLAQVSVGVPYAWGTVTGDVMEVTQSVTRSGFGDPQLRFAVNLIGGPALTPQQFRTRTPQTTLGASLTVLCPFGEYFPSKLINIGTNRWAFKPELGLSHPAGRWTFEAYAGVWFFTDNSDFFGGHVRTQNPLASYQAHVIYNVNPRMWAAFDFTYYSGGQTTLDGQRKDDRQNNTRGGLTFAVPITPHQSLKASWANGVTARIGTKFQTIAVGWQYVWFDSVKPPAGT
jgi:hypothetical protein